MILILIYSTEPRPLPSPKLIKISGYISISVQILLPAKKTVKNFFRTRENRTLKNRKFANTHWVKTSTTYRNAELSRNSKTQYEHYMIKYRYKKSAASQYSKKLSFLKCKITILCLLI